MSEQPLRVVVIGSVAAGPKAACRISRLCPTAEVTVLDKGQFISYAGCGLPYYVSGAVHEQDELISTSAGTVRDAGFFEKVKNVRVHVRTEAESIDRARRTVTARDLRTQEVKVFPYDRLILATGASPVVPPFAGADLERVLTVHRIEEAEAIKTLVAGGTVQRAVVIGGGLIGLEMMEALAEKGVAVTLIERLPEILPMMDAEVAALVRKHIRAKGVDVRVGTTVKAISGTRRAERVITDQGDVPCDLVIVAVGVRPNVGLAREAGLDIGPTGGLVTDPAMRTSDPYIFAAGDCVESRHLLSGRPVYVPLGSTANKQGRVAANTICAVPDQFPGVLGTMVCKVFDFTVGRVGLGTAQAREAGFDPVEVLAPAPDRAHYYPSAKLVGMKLIADRKTRRLLGVQVAGPGAGDKRIDAAAAAITGRLTVDDLANMDLAYAPPYASAMDNLITAANIARNKLGGLMNFITPSDVQARLDRGEDFILLDVRTPKEFGNGSLPTARSLPLGALRAKLAELPKDKDIVAFCQISLRGYEAALILKAAGLTRVQVMDGGVAMWPY